MDWLVHNVLSTYIVLKNRGSLFLFGCIVVHILDVIIRLVIKRDNINRSTARKDQVFMVTLFYDYSLNYFIDLNNLFVLTYTCTIQF